MVDSAILVFRFDFIVLCTDHPTPAVVLAATGN